MIRRVTTTLFVVAGLIGIACVDMSAPKGAASISTVLLPSPSVIVGDSMRDSLGVARPITVTAYDGNGNPIEGATVDLFIIDSSHVAHLTPGNVLVGDKIGSTRLLGQVQGLQTPGITVPVTYAPAKIEAIVPDTLRPNAGVDSASSLASSAVSARVRSSDDSVSQGIIVTFTLVHLPNRHPTAPGTVAFLADDGNHAASRDTTDASGTARLRLVVNARALDPEVVFGKLDSAVVKAEATYKGKPLAGSPVSIVVPIRSRPLAANP